MSIYQHHSFSLMAITILIKSKKPEEDFNNDVIFGEMPQILLFISFDNEAEHLFYKTNRNYQRSNKT